MVAFLCLRWWYSGGWRWIWDCLLVERLIWVNEVFSTADLIRTIFAPYRQTFAGAVNGSIGAKFRAFVDRSISRVIGAIVRLFLIFAAMIGSLLVATVAFITLIAWPILPLMPIISIGLMISGALL